MLFVLAYQVLPLTSGNFTALRDPAFVKFFAPWCGHCKALAPEYERLAALVDFPVYEVDCTVEQDICRSEGVSGFPTLKFYAQGTAYVFDGERSAEALVDFSRRMLQPALYSGRNCLNEEPCFLISSSDFEQDEALFKFVKIGYNYAVQEGPFEVSVTIDGERFSTYDKALVQAFFKKYRNGFLPELLPELFEDLAYQHKRIAVIMLNSSDSSAEFVALAKRNTEDVILTYMNVQQWSYFASLFNITSTPHAVFLDFSQGEHFYAYKTETAAEFEQFVSDVLQGRAKEIKMAPPDSMVSKVSSVILAVAVGLVVFLGIAFALKCLKKQAAGELNVEQIAGATAAKEVSEAPVPESAGTASDTAAKEKKND